MASTPPNFFFPHPSPPPPSHFNPPPPPSHFNPPPPPPHSSPPPPPPPFRHPPPPPPPHLFPPPPPPHVRPPPTPHRPVAPPPPHVRPPPPALPPSPSPNHPIVIIVVVVSLGGLLLLSMLAFALFFCVQKRKKKTQETDIIHFDEHKTVKETIVPGPFGKNTVVITVEDDVHISENIKKTDEVGHGLHAIAKSSNEVVKDKGESSGVDVGTSTATSPGREEHHQDHQPQPENMA